MRWLLILLIGLVVAAVVYAVTGGRVIVLPLLLILPLGGFLWKRSSDRR